MNLNILITSIIGGMLLGSGITAMFMMLYFTNQVNELAELYQDTTVYSHELNKACDAHRMYLMNILDKHDISYHK